MPSYEASFILRTMGRPDTANVLKRIALKIIDSRGLLFKVENLGSRKLPHAIRAHGMKCLDGR